MLTYFSCHTIRLDIDQATRQRLWDQHLIAIHYPEDCNGNILDTDNESLNPKDYPSRPGGVIRAFVELAREGGFVWAQYYGSEHRLVGRVEPHTEIELMRGIWGTGTVYGGRRAVLKTLPLQHVKVVYPGDQAEIEAVQHGQGTFHRWWKVGDAIQRLVGDQPKDETRPSRFVSQPGEVTITPPKDETRQDRVWAANDKRLFKREAD